MIFNVIWIYFFGLWVSNCRLVYCKGPLTNRKGESKRQIDVREGGGPSEWRLENGRITSKIFYNRNSLQTSISVVCLIHLAQNWVLACISLSISSYVLVYKLFLHPLITAGYYQFTLIKYFTNKVSYSHMVWYHHIA